MAKWFALVCAAVLCTVCAGAAEFDSAAEIAKLQESGGRVTSGESSDVGCWVIAIGEAVAEGLSEADAKAAAALNARNEVASFFSVQVASQTESSMVKDESGRKSRFSRWVRTDVTELLRGVRVESNRIEGGKAIAVAVLTERTIDATNRMKQAMADERSGTVEAFGEGKTPDEALEMAKRNALEQVCGVSVVASDAKLGDEAVVSRAFTDVQGLVSAYRILDQSQEDGLYKVRIVAEISQEELQDSYGAQMKSIGDPIFWITSDNEDAAVQIADFLMAKGMKTSVQQAGSDYKVLLKSEFQSVVHPIRKRQGTQLQLTAMCYDKGGVLMFSLPNDPRKASVFTGGAERQKQLAVDKAVKQIARPLHERLQRAVADMVNNGRIVRLVFRNVLTAEQCGWIEDITAQLNEFPGATSATSSRNDAVAVSTIRVTLKGNPEDFLQLLRTRIPDLPSALTVSTNKIVFEL